MSSLLRQAFMGDAFTQALMGHGLTSQNHTELIHKMFTAGFITTERLKNFMLKVDRRDFVGKDPYSNTPFKLTPQHSVSTPQFHAQLLSIVEGAICRDSRVLDIGTGTGYLAAVMAELGCKEVVATEVDPVMYQAACANLRKYGNVEVQLKSPEEPLFGPNEDLYDAIIISPALSDFNIVIEHLNDQGRAAIVHQQPHGMFLTSIYKDGSNVIQEQLTGVACEPLMTARIVDQCRTVNATYAPKSMLEDWKSAFMKEHGRAPTRHDMLSDSVAFEAFKNFSSKTKLH